MCNGWRVRQGQPRGSTAVVVRVRRCSASPRGFVCVEQMCLQNAGETQCLRLRRLSAGGECLGIGKRNVFEAVDSGGAGDLLFTMDLVYNK